MDVEKGDISPAPTGLEEGEDKDPRDHRLSNLYRKYRLVVHVAIWMVMTGWWVAGLVLHHADKNWIIPFLLWLAISLRLLFLHVPITIVSKPMRWVWQNTASRVVAFIPERFRLWAGAAVTAAVIIVGAFASEERADNTRENRAVSLFGLVVCLFVLWATSRDRKRINWHAVIMGMLVQFIVALFVLRTKAGFDIFNFISTLARELLGFAGDGVSFLTAPTVNELGWFLTGVVPPVIFFVALVQLLYYWGTIQWFVSKFAVFFFWSMRVSGAEAVVAAATPFIGQGESAMLIKPFIPHLTLAELHQIMACGFATIAGSVLVAYIGMGLNAQALVSSCIMSIPASLAMSKLRYPESEETLTSGRVVVPDNDEHKAANGLHAFANGAWLGIKIGGMIVATLLVIIALLNLVSGLLTWWGRYLNLTGQYDLTVELIVGYLCYPIAFLLGVPRGPDLMKVARLIGIKIVSNEYVAYKMLTTEAAYATLSPRSQLIATYSLCGFGNIGSLGTQIGILSQLAPGRSGDVSRVAFSALMTGVLSTLSSAAIAGLLVQNETTFFSGSS
ncbi:hypothetical protein K431DRAFT_257185 [Polychaeton citri CBS 116435]|uniref:H+/nucleoside cotransporter n=1 Tax=Polychaeton citri CBS 116435 TaxID=1314669 RepID=A0A9P4PZG8_9PEZI|nr:hypothetical protein K431DRAFT_257185 [Polychaeton citri CBS 116435]